jgi:hypothetical protein
VSHGSLRSRGSRFDAAAFLTRSQTKSVSARSLVQDSGARSWRCESAYFVVSRGGMNASAHSSSTHLAAGARSARAICLGTAARDSRRSQLCVSRLVSSPDLTQSIADLAHRGSQPESILHRD